jgi:hypothetical protein
MKSTFLALVLIAVLSLFATPLAADTGSVQITGAVPLRIFNVEITNVSEGSATISWKTNADSTTQVHYDIRSRADHSEYTQHSDRADSPVIQHSRVLRNLQPGNPYYFQAESIYDLGGVEQLAISQEFSFVTTAAPYHYENVIVTSIPSRIESSDTRLSLSIPQGTTFRDARGMIGAYITVDPMSAHSQPTPPGSSIIGLIYNLGPDGGSFDRPITITLSYDPAELSSSANEKDLIICFWDDSSGVWIELRDCVVDTQKHTVSASLSHFTPYAILYKPELASLQVTLPTVTQTDKSTTQPNNSGQANTAPEVKSENSVVLNRFIAPTFTFSGLKIFPLEAFYKQKVTISTVLGNSGDLKGTCPVLFKLNGKLVEVKDITLEGNTSQSISFQFVPDKIGANWIQINDQSIKLPVKIPPLFTIMFGIIVGIYSLTLAVLLFIRNRLKSRYAVER